MKKKFIYSFMIAAAAAGFGEYSGDDAGPKCG
ncbi:hypothetical protein HMPREF1075_03376 [Parabacteroides distasonis CL03T12C09]|nr:hypothetical protein HMPREF1075_03376 [Parabacteroides distasonis CL03T12C09]